jgi:hypothetical protein
MELGCVFIDENPACPRDEKYKMVVRWRPSEDVHHDVYVLKSADGIHFELLSDEPVFRDSDTGNVCFWDPRTGRYAAYVRKWLKRQSPRVVCRCEFDDITSWGEETVVLAADERDPVDIDFYTNCTVKYEGVYLMFPSVLHNPADARELAEHKINYGMMDIQLAVSRDGVAWERPDRSPFVRLSSAGGWDSRILYMFTGYVRHEDELWMYYWGRNYPHSTGTQYPDKPMVTAIGRLRLRVDGFVSADAPYEGGTLTTRPLLFSGNRLELNIETSVPGGAKVEVLGLTGKPVPKFTAGESDEIMGSFTGKTVTWNTNADVSELEGKPVRLRFHLKDAKLYAFQFCE